MKSIEGAIPCALTRRDFIAGSVTYYRNLLGAENEQPQKGRFRVGNSVLELGQARFDDSHTDSYSPAQMVTTV